VGPLSLIPGVAGLRCMGIGLMLAGVTSITSGLIYHHKGVVKGRAEVQAKFDRAVAEANAAAGAASEAYRRLELQREADRDEAQRINAERKAQNDKAIASIRAAAGDDVRRMRDALAAATSPSGAATADPAAADPGDCAAAGGRLLGEALQLAGELAGDAESAAAAYRAMREAWPVSRAPAR
jgi:hypothetical protein